MINSIIEAISIALNAEFTETEYEMYMEEVRQDLKEPCFFIFCINPSQRLFLGRRYFREHAFCIQYFPKDGNRECNEVMERLYSCLEWLKVGEDLVMGTKMRGEIIDGVLNFFVNYDMFMYFAQQNEEPSMEGFQQKTTMKEGDKGNG